MEEEKKISNFQSQPLTIEQIYAAELRSNDNTPFDEQMVAKLREMLHVNTNERHLMDAFAWKPQQQTFNIQNPRKFVEKVMPRYYKKQNELTTFDRQLKMIEISKALNAFGQERITENQKMSKNKKYSSRTSGKKHHHRATRLNNLAAARKHSVKEDESNISSSHDRLDLNNHSLLESGEKGRIDLPHTTVFPKPDETDSFLEKNSMVSVVSSQDCTAPNAATLSRIRSILDVPVLSITPPPPPPTPSLTMKHIVTLASLSNLRVMSDNINDVDITRDLVEEEISASAMRLAFLRRI